MSRIKDKYPWLPQEVAEKIYGPPVNTDELNGKSVFQTREHIVYTGGTVSAKKLSLKSLALSGLFGAKWSFPKKSFS